MLGGAVAAPAARSAPIKATGLVLSGVPLVYQTFNACGPASIAQVAEYFGVHVALPDVSARTRASERSYMNADAIVRFAPSVGLSARLFTGGSLASVRAAVSRQLPLIVLQDLVTASAVIPHWRVVTGFDDTRQVVYLMDPLLGYVLMSYMDFERAWTPHRGLFAVMFPPAWAKTVQTAFN